MKNLLKEKLAGNGVALGATVMLPHPEIARALSLAGFDWLFLDAEHGPMDLETLQLMIQCMDAACTPIVRVAWNDVALIKRALDLGAHGIIVPMVSSREEAEAAVKACKYPPEGVRGYGPRPGLYDDQYFQTANREVMTIALIETAAAVKNIDDIMAVPGIDVGLIGVADLSLSLGLGLPIKWSDSRYLEVFDKVVKAAKKYAKVCGIPSGFAGIASTGSSPGSAEWAIARGFRLITVGDADSFIKQGAQAVLQSARAAIGRLNS